MRREMNRTRPQTLINASNPLNLVFLDHELPASVKRVDDSTSPDHREVFYGCMVE